jgi:NADH-quinone oxidoreductase subunit A
MIDNAGDTQALWPMAVYFIAVLALVAVMLGMSYILGERHRDILTSQPYESGITPTGSARQRFHIRFYLTAMFFVVFDLEAVFVYAWAVSIRENGWPGYIEMLVFIGVLAASLVYLWKAKALDWETRKAVKE